MEIAGEGSISIRHAKVNNLKDISVDIPRNALVVITGISGSGKSSLAFDTLFAEGQRRFAESLSSYARQFLGRMSKPDVESIEGIPPAIAIEQKVNIKNPRSTVATTTEIYDYLRILFARIGRTFSPVSGVEVRRSGATDVLDHILAHPGSAVYLLADIGWASRTDRTETLLSLKEEGFSRLWSGGRAVTIEEVLQMGSSAPDDILLMIDRMKVPSGTSPVPDNSDFVSRVLDSVKTAFERGDGALEVVVDGQMKRFSTRMEADGMTFSVPDEYMFSFNSPLGACPVCGGLGKIIGISEDLVVPDKTKSIYDGAIACWRGEKMSWFKELVIKNAEKYDIPIFTPYAKLPEKARKTLWEARADYNDDTTICGLNEFFEWVESNRYKIQYKYMLSRYSGRTVCHECGGSRLRKDALYVRVGGKNINEILQTDVDSLVDFFEGIRLTDYERDIAGKTIEEILYRLRCIKDVGLGYLTLSRSMNTLSGGESQRVNLVTALGSSLVGSMYILDEPSIGLHPRDTERLIAVLRRLRDIGNTVIVVEHDKEIIEAADYLIDLGPRAGIDGGRIVFQGCLQRTAPSAAKPCCDGKLFFGTGPEKPISHLRTSSVTQRTSPLSTDASDPAPESLTLQYLSGERKQYVREKRKWQYSITVEGAMQNNLKDIDVKFPLGVFTVVTGVSGSGKSSLVGDILYPALHRLINETGDTPGVFKHLGGNLDRIQRVEYVDQNPIGKSSRSNAVTYLKVYDDIRKLLSEQQYAKINGFTPSFFSFNQEGGRCPECQGEGFVHIGMQFMADVTMVCESCGGKRFKPEILEVKYQGKNVHDILEMSVEEAIAFFGAQKEEQAKTIAAKLQPLVDVGLGYIKLGQPSSTLSGGESQRIKLAYFLSIGDDKPRREKIMFIFDEPTTGLHFYDVEKLLRAFDVLIDKGHTVIVVEHNVDVIKSADWVIDLGPDAGDAGGEVVYTGTPEKLAAEGNTFTAQYLR